jgi:hypothetical protein
VTTAQGRRRPRPKAVPKTMSRSRFHRSAATANGGLTSSGARSGTVTARHMTPEEAVRVGHVCGPQCVAVGERRVTCPHRWTDWKLYGKREKRRCERCNRVQSRTPEWKQLPVWRRTDRGER